MKYTKIYFFLGMLISTFQIRSIENNKPFQSQLSLQQQDTSKPKLIIINSNYILGGLTSLGVTYGTLYLCVHKLHIQPTTSNRIFALTAVTGANTLVYTAYKFFEILTAKN
jgi:hypothetical protein